jgi:hypothetical protein
LLPTNTLLKNHAEASANRIAPMIASTSRRLRQPIALGIAFMLTIGGSSTRHADGSTSSRVPSSGPPYGTP